MEKINHECYLILIKGAYFNRINNEMYEMAYFQNEIELWILQFLQLGIEILSYDNLTEGLIGAFHNGNYSEFRPVLNYDYLGVILKVRGFNPSHFKILINSFPLKNEVITVEIRQVKSNTLKLHQ